jgi:DNA-binding NarL/FixJ family response regulator
MPQIKLTQLKKDENEFSSEGISFSSLLSYHKSAGRKADSQEVAQKIDSVLSGVSKQGLRVLLENLSSMLPKNEFAEVLSILSTGSSSEDVGEDDFPTNLLTPKEEEIIFRLAQGQRNQQIAKELFISCHTVRTHRNSIHRKLKICGKGLNPLVFYKKYVNATLCGDEM